VIASALPKSSRSGQEYIYQVPDKDKQLSHSEFSIIEINQLDYFVINTSGACF
jgi:hypothetical protein